MLITVKTLSGRKLAFEMETTQTIGEIKDKLFEKEQIPKDQIRLIYGGKTLDNNDSSIESWNIKPGTDIMMAMHLKG